MDYIINKAGIREIEVLQAAVERRKHNLDRSPVGEASDPQQAAKKTAESVYASIDASMAGVRDILRNYAADLLYKEAPELSKEQLEALLDSWIPVVKANSEKVGGIPPDVLYEMVIQFVSYSIGEMTDTTQRELAAAIRNWPQAYWQRFPTGVRQEIKAFLDGKITSGAFQRNVRDLIGMP